MVVFYIRVCILKLRNKNGRRCEETREKKKVVSSRKFFFGGGLTRLEKKSFLSFTTDKKGHSSTTNECKAEMGHRTNFSSSVKRKKKEEVHTKTPLSLVGKKLV